MFLLQGSKQKLSNALHGPLSHSWIVMATRNFECGLEKRILWQLENTLFVSFRVKWAAGFSSESKKNV